MKQEFNRSNIIFCVKDAFAEGGMPNDIRQFIAGNLNADKFSTSLITNYCKIDDFKELENLNVIKAKNPNELLRIKLHNFHKKSIFVFIGYSSLYNLVFSMRLKIIGYKYCIIPSWQIHPFLDLDNPFEKSSVPSIANLTSGVNRDTAPIFKRVVNGKPNLLSYLNLMKRLFYRKTFGKLYIEGAEKVFVFSDHERNNVLSYFKVKQKQFRYIHFGANLNFFKEGNGNFPESGCINIIFWGRVDFFYKGLDTILRSISIAKEKGINQRFKLWIVGPDYNKGYNKVKNMVQELEIHDFVQLLKPGEYEPGTIDLLKNADFSISSPKWDGFSRSMRESICLGVPIITNQETHFDRVISKFENGLLFKDEEDLSNLLMDLNSAAVRKVRKASKENQSDCTNFFNWNEAAALFQKNLSD